MAELVKSGRDLQLVRSQAHLTTLDAIETVRCGYAAIALATIAEVAYIWANRLLRLTYLPHPSQGSSNGKLEKTPRVWGPGGAGCGGASSEANRGRGSMTPVNPFKSVIS